MEQTELNHYPFTRLHDDGSMFLTKLCDDKAIVLAGMVGHFYQDTTPGRVTCPRCVELIANPPPELLPWIKEAKLWDSLAPDDATGAQKKKLWGERPWTQFPPCVKPCAFPHCKGLVQGTLFHRKAAYGNNTHCGLTPSDHPIHSSPPTCPACLKGYTFTAGDKLNEKMRIRDERRAAKAAARAGKAH